MVKIAHLSDLHFGRTHKEALSALAASLAEIEPDLTVITGDFTQSGRRKEFAEAAAFLSSLSCPVLAVPGNHDTPVYNLIMRFFRPWRRFEKHIGAVSLQRMRVGDICFIGVNSARRAQPRLNWSYGRLSKTIINEVAHLAGSEQASGQHVFLALHHPLVVAPNKAGAEIVGNGEYALSRFAEAGVRAVLTGHVHLSAIAPIEATQGRILSIQAGTALSTRERGEKASFGVLEAAKNKLTLTRHGFTGALFYPQAPQSYALRDGVWCAI